MRGVVVHRFGPFELDSASRQLYRDQMPVRLSSPQSAILALLVSNRGTIVSREQLIDAGWGGAAINDNTLNQTIVRLRQLLSGEDSAAAYIETLPQQGYRFTAAVQQAEHPGTEATLEVQLAPFRAFLEGQTELDTLDREGIRRARRAYEAVVREASDYAPGHIGLATACGLVYEATALDATPDAGALEIALLHARAACKLAPSSGEAWSALAFVLRLSGDAEIAGAAAIKAMHADRQNWRLALRAAYACWGDDRIEAASQLLTLRPGLALGHWFMTTVFISRGAFTVALREARAGCAAQDVQPPGARIPAIGLHLLHGLILAAHDHLDAAVEEFKRELPWTDSGQLYARECAANTWYALGAVYVRQQKRAEAQAAFERALTIAPRHVSALAALRGEVGPPKGGHYIDAAIGQAIVLARGNRHADAARVYEEAVQKAPPGIAGWMLPVEPTLYPQAHPDLWDRALTIVRNRAT